MVEFYAGFLIGATLVTVILGAHFVKLTGELREQISKLQADRPAKQITLLLDSEY